MSRLVFKQTLFLFAVLLLILNSKNLRAQISIVDKLSNPVKEISTDSTNQKITFDNINREIEVTDYLILKTGISEYNIKKQNKLIEEVEKMHNFILEQGKEFKESGEAGNSQFFLINAKYSWTEFYVTLRNYQNDLQRMVREMQEKQNVYINNTNKWERSLPELDKNLSDQISGHISSNLSRINGIISEFDVMIRNLVNAENKIIQDIGFADGILSEITGLKEKRRTELFKKTEKNIFSIKFNENHFGSFRENAKNAYNQTIRSFDYFNDNVKRNLFNYLIATLLIVILIYYIHKKYKQLNIALEDIDHIRIKRIVIQKPGLTVVAIMFFFWTVIVPYSPFVLTLLLYLSILILLYIILSPVLHPFLKRIDKAVIILLLLSNLEILIWHFGNSSRLYIILETVVAILLTYKYLIPGRNLKEIKKQNKGLIITTQIIVIFIFVFYSVALISNIFGYLNLTLYSLKLGVYTGVISLIVHGFYRIFSSLVHASVSVLNIYYPDIVRKYGNNIIFKTNRIVKIFLGYLWLSGMIRISELSESVNSKLEVIFTDPVKIGSLTFTLGKLLLFFAILYITYSVAKFIKRIFEREILSKHKMKRGVAASISLTVRILLVFIGTLLALSVSGMDLGKISIIAGALSVGIGFGLQNIVNNFISGLILVYEKPVQEGDTIEVDTLMGKVSNIGTRSSTITTYSGADVVVPNSNLISNQLINWTLSDNRRRMEVKVGTAYGTDPEKVLELILEAATSHKKVLKDPPPLPLFEGFGDSSLNFRLLFWVHFEDGVQTQSDVAIKVYKLFKEYNIEIPFPQLDLHIKEKNETNSGEEV
jgi:small-conductance mechanosensitive channel